MPNLKKVNRPNLVNLTTADIKNLIIAKETPNKLTQRQINFLVKKTWLVNDSLTDSGNHAIKWAYRMQKCEQLSKHSRHSLVEMAIRLVRISCISHSSEFTKHDLISFILDVTNLV